MLCVNEIHHSRESLAISLRNLENQKMIPILGLNFYAIESRVEKVIGGKNKEESTFHTLWT